MKHLWHGYCMDLQECRVAISLLVIVILYATATYSAERSSNQDLQLGDLLKTDVSTTLTIVRASQGILSASMSKALDGAFVLLQWNQIDRPDGLPYLNLLALSPTTGAAGTWSLVRSPSTGISTKLWAVLRVALTAFIWLSGLSLFFNTSIITVYDTGHVYPVTAGVGAFNGSLVQPFRDFLHSLNPGYDYETLPYTYFAAAYTLVINPLIATVAQPHKCSLSDGQCVSYLLSGGLAMVVPWLPRGYEDYSMVKVKQAPSIQIDFNSPAEDTFRDSDCDVFGANTTVIGIRMCLAESDSDPGYIRAGVFVCTNGTNAGACEVGEPVPNITTQVSFYTLQSSFVASRSNYSIVSVTDTTPTEQILHLDLPAYRDALRWLLNYTAADLPPPSSIAQSFWSSQRQLSDPSTWGPLSQNFQSILAFPFWLFNANNWGNTELQENVTISTLSPEFYTEASLLEPYVEIRFDPGMFALFLLLQTLTMVFVWGILVWVWFRDKIALRTSSFPLFDIAFRADVQSDVVGKGNLGDHEERECLWWALHVCRPRCLIFKRVVFIDQHS